MCTRILIIEDDEALRRLLQIDLEQHGYQVITAKDGTLGLLKFRETYPELVVIDVALPGIDGREVCRQIRNENDRVPILMMSAHAITEQDIAEGLNIGADEYMVKPLGQIEFHARINALLRRAQLSQPEPDTITSYDDGYLQVDVNARRVYVADQEIRLTPTEFNLLVTFLENAGHVLTFEQILGTVWGVEYKNEHHYPRIYVSHLRRKIEPDIKNPTYIHNEYGIGYRFTGQRAS